MDRRGGFLLASAFLIAFSIFPSQNGAAADFTALNATSSEVVIPQSNYMINITINNTDTTYNIINVNVTITGTGFILGSNSTTASNTAFNNAGSILVWSNTTDNGFVATQDNPQHFAFNVSIPSSLSGYYNFTVNITDTAGASNSTNVTYTLILHNLTFFNLTAMQNSTNLSQNISYLIRITNDGVPLQEQYNLSVVNCSNT